MKLYHGSNTEIIEIDLNKCKPYKDFGKGFYLTTIRAQAERMAQRVARIYGGKPCVTIYEFDETAFSDPILNTMRFDGPNISWAMFVINNRSRQFGPASDPACNLNGKYDIVTGPIADDDLALLFRQFSNGLITVEMLVKGMEYKKLTDQYSFHSERALRYLKKTGVL